MAEIENGNISIEDGCTVKKSKEIEISIKEPTWIPEKAKKNYHEQRLEQSKWAFRLSFGGSIVGFTVIVISAIVCIYMEQFNWVGIVSGTIIESVSALFFTMSNKANEKISEFFDKLTLDSNTTHAMEMTKEIKDDHIRDQLLVKLSLHLSGIDESKICKNVKEVCNKGNEENT